MQSPVKIKKLERSIRLSFSYNQDLVDIMREENGLWHRKTKTWIFPLSKLSHIRDVLTDNKYRVTIATDKQQVISLKERFKNNNITII